jgi:hypothetical protein
VKVAGPQGGFTKVGFDPLGRVLRQVSASAEGNDNAPTTFVDDVVLSETVQEYDVAGNVILTTTYSRKHDASATGLLSDSPSAARVTYQAAWYDDAHRPTHVAEYGAAP